MAKSKVYEFDPVIYPMRLWISVKPAVEDIQKDFLLLDDNDEVIETKEPFGRTTVAQTISVAHKKSSWMGCYVAILLPRQCDVGIITHESGHVTDWMCDHFGVGGFSFMDGEARQYFAQWVARCIDKVLKGRV